MFRPERFIAKPDHAADAQRMMQEDQQRLGDVAPLSQKDPKWQQEINERLLREDHDVNE